MKRGLVGPVVLVVLALFTAVHASAQEVAPRTHVSMGAGIFQFDMADKGVAPLVGVRGTSPVGTALLLELSLLAAWPRPEGDEATTVLVPEGQLQLVLPLHRLVPYMGLGTGALVDLNGKGEGRRETVLTLSGSLGLKAWLTERLGGQAELRVRGVGAEMEDSSAEYTVGVIWGL